MNSRGVIRVEKRDDRVFLVVWKETVSSVRKGERDITT